MASSNVEITSYIPYRVECKNSPTGPDREGDGYPNRLDIDSDGDGLANVLPAEKDSEKDRFNDRFDTVFGGMSVENAGGSSVELPDRNGDGKPDQVDAGVPVKVLRVYLPGVGRKDKVGAIARWIAWKIWPLRSR